MISFLSNGWCFDSVEQLLYGMVRNCRDQVRARTPEKFSTLFKVIHRTFWCMHTYKLS